MLAIQRFTVTGAIDVAFRIYRDHFKTLFVLSLIVGVPATLTNLAFKVLVFRLQELDWGRGFDVIDPTTGLKLLPLLAIVLVFLCISFLVSLVASMFGLAATTRIASLVALGKPATLALGLREAGRVFWPLLSASMLVVLAVSLGLVLLVVPGIVLALSFVFVSPVVVLERLSASDALARSYRLARGRRWKIFGTAVLYFLIVASASGGLLAAAMLGGFIGSDTLAGTVVETLLGQAMGVLATPVWYIATVLLYYDARVEAEGFDIQMLAEQAPRTP